MGWNGRGKERNRLLLVRSHPHQRKMTDLERFVSILNPYVAPKCSPYARPEPPTVSSLAPLACTTCATRGGVASVAHPLHAGAGLVVAAQQRSGSRHRRRRQLTTLLRAKPSKDGDAESRD